MGNPPLYASWKKLYPRYQPGRFRTWKTRIAWVLLGTYFLLPWLRWSRPGEEITQAIWFDLPGRRFYLFDLTLWPQDIFLLSLLLIALAIGLFLMTALGGRVFCGYLCFQTLWADWFLWVERLLEGERNQRLRLDHLPWTARKLGIKLAKLITLLSLSWLTGMTFVFYFRNAPDQLVEFMTGTASEPAWMTALLLASTTYLFAGLAREQVCTYMCPYARFQGVMVDVDTLTVAYDERRGEPRLASRRVRRSEGSVAGDCIDCRECVRVCPMGIDIRDGQQYQCTTCAACVDACDSVMDRLDQPRGLISYTSLRSLSGERIRWFRPRILLYSGLLLALIAGMVGYLLQRSPVEMTVIRQRQPMAIVMSDGSIQNNYTVRILNKGTREHHYRLRVTGLPEARWITAGQAGATPADELPLAVAAGEATPFAVYLRKPPEVAAPERTEITFVLEATTPGGGTVHYHTSFVRP